MLAFCRFSANRVKNSFRNRLHRKSALRFDTQIQRGSACAHRDIQTSSQGVTFSFISAPVFDSLPECDGMFFAYYLEQFRTMTQTRYSKHRELPPNFQVGVLCHSCVNVRHLQCFRFKETTDNWNWASQMTINKPSAQRIVCPNSGPKYGTFRLRGVCVRYALHTQCEYTRTQRHAIRKASVCFYTHTISVDNAVASPAVRYSAEICAPCP